MKETPNVIAISETKLNENSRVNIDIPGYTFLSTNSKSAAEENTKECLDWLYF